MSGPITRKIALAQQIEEQKVTLEEAPPRAVTAKLADERMERRRAILSTLQFNLDHEHLFRAFMAERKGQGLRFRMRGGYLHVVTDTSQGENWLQLGADAANAALERFDAPATAALT